MFQKTQYLTIIVLVASKENYLFIWCFPTGYLRCDCRTTTHNVDKKSQRMSLA